MKRLKEKEKIDKTKETQEEKFRHTFLHTNMLIQYIQTCLTHNCDFTYRFFTAPTLLHTIAFTHKHC